MGIWYESSLRRGKSNQAGPKRETILRRFRFFPSTWNARRAQYTMNRTFCFETSRAYGAERPLFQARLRVVVARDAVKLVADMKGGDGLNR